MGLMDTIFGSYSKKQLKKIEPIVKKTMSLENEYKELSDSELTEKTEIFKKRLENGETLDDIMPEAFATVREAANRVIGQMPYESQVIGAVVLAQGRIAEMKTGEGKTLTSVMPAYLNALSGKGVHIVTVNDYLAKRDSEWMGKIHRFLGLTVGLVIPEKAPVEHREAYACDITYGTNNEFGFDFLRDNMVLYKHDMVQRGHNYAIVDEVDSILIDEARTPLIIAGHGEKADEMYNKTDKFVRKLKAFTIQEMDSKESYENIEEDYIVEEKNKHTVLTARGIEKAQREFGIENLADNENVGIQHYINQALHAYGVKQRDIDYVVKDDQVIIVDEFTGRLMFGRHYSDGLHQAIEAKEKVNIKNESKTLATITFQNYFRIYAKLSGMTGTALTEEEEFRQIYNLDVIEIPTNKPMIRLDNNDRIYKTVSGKRTATINQIIECHEKGQPVLVGTITIEKSEQLSDELKRRGIAHNVLNAKNHDKEAMIVAQAGKKGAVTIATNMAGRGTDIILGGNSEYMAKQQMEREGFEYEYIVASTGMAPTEDTEVLRARTRFKELNSKYKEDVAKEAQEVKAAGGLYILGTERHESRRIDNQLRGRSGRQGDMGESCFYLSLEDDLIRLFGGDRVGNIASMLNIPEDQAIDAKILSNTIESAQKKVESSNFARRKRVLEYDDIINKQRSIIYDQRKKVLDGEDLSSYINKMAEDVIDNAVEKYLTGDIPDNWDFNGLRNDFKGYFLTDDDVNYGTEDFDWLNKETVKDELLTKERNAYSETERINTPDTMREIERVILLKTVDKYWMAHIDAMDDLRRGVSLRGYSQRDPLVEYKFESYDMFEEMISVIKYETVRLLLNARVVRKDQIKRESVAKPIFEGRADEDGDKPKVKPKQSPVVNVKKVGPNEPCPCGSGKKYKKCCGQ